MIAPRLIRSDLAITLTPADLIGRLPAVIPYLYARLLHALVDELDQLLAAVFRQRRDIEPDDRPVDIRDEA